MTLSVHMVVAAALVITLGVFLAAFKFALREALAQREHAYAPELPRAEVVIGNAPGSQWARGAGKQRAMRSIQYLQAGVVAFGITAVFIMLLCMAGIVTVMLVA